MNYKFLSFALIFTFQLISQDIFITKRDYSVIPNIYSIEKFNHTNSNLTTEYIFKSEPFNDYAHGIREITFNPKSNEFFTAGSNHIVKYNIFTGVESFFSLPIEEREDYGDIIIANNRLFITKRNYSDPLNYVYSLIELNQTNGQITKRYEYMTKTPSSYSPSSLTYNSLTKEIIGISDTVVVKFNIETDLETSFTLPNIQNGDYGSMVIAENRLFITKRDYSDPMNYIHELIELNQMDGSVISSYIFKTAFTNTYSPSSLTFDNTSKDIFGVSGNIVVQYNILTGIEKSHLLPDQETIIYLASISTNSNETLSVENEIKNSTELKPIKAYNLTGREVDIDKKNELIIVIYDDGTSRKVFNQ